MQVGQTVYIRYDDPRRHREAPLATYKITKVGRKWVTIGTLGGADVYRFDLTDPDMRLDGQGYSSPGRVYLTREAWETARRKMVAWDALCRFTQHRFKAPDALTAEQIEQAARILGVPYM